MVKLTKTLTKFSDGLHSTLTLNAPLKIFTETNNAYSAQKKEKTKGEKPSLLSVGIR